MDTSFVKKLALGVIIITTLLFSLFSLAISYYVSADLLEKALKNSQSEIDNTALLINDRLETVAVALENCEQPTKNSNFNEIITNILKHNPEFYGSAIALDPSIGYYMAYAHRNSDGTIVIKEFKDTSEYNYPKMEWFSSSISTNKDTWSEPYFDEGAGNKFMCTYSHIFNDADSTFRGVVTADISLDLGVHGLMEEFDADDGSKTYMLSNNGYLLYGDTIVDKDDMEYQAALPNTKWTIGHIMAKDKILEPLYDSLFNLLILYIVTLAIVCTSLFLIIRYLSGPTLKRQMRLNTELDVAQRIQKGMLPKESSSVFDRKKVNLSAIMQPAKEVGGDFYNYFIENDKLYFVIADVSGKGVPDAILMAIATELFLIASPWQTDPAKIVSNINTIMCRDNKEAMFVTMIVGILDLKTNELKLCNAGHNHPVIILEEENPRMCKLDTNIMVGFINDFKYTSHSMKFPKGTKIILYTDGVTEAENASHELYGEKRLFDLIIRNSRASAQQLSHIIENDVKKHADGIGQSDDITLLVIETLGESEES